MKLLLSSSHPTPNVLFYLPYGYVYSILEIPTRQDRNQTEARNELPLHCLGVHSNYESTDD